ncbi:MAG: ABC transporter permease [Ruminococcus sp.]|nr:ABC transporter permease [Ruminococcus sp.]
MNVFNRVTMQSLRKNKTRTIVTIIGIVLSTALICAVMISFASMINYMKQYIIDSNGKWHIRADSMNYETFSEIKDDSEISEYIGLKEIGYAEMDGQNKYKPYLYITEVVGKNDDMVAVNITDGKYPESADEILLPEHLYTNGGIKYDIGDTIELEIGYRISDGQKLHQNNPTFLDHYVDGQYTEEFLEEDFVPEFKRTYKVSGFYKRPQFENYNSAGYTAIVTDDGYNDDTLYQMFFTVKKPKNVYSFMENHHLDGTYNYELLTFMGVMSEFDGLNAMIISTFTILIILIMFGSVSLIYNAFSISVSERTKQFGLLSSIGATKKQLRRMVFFEAFVVSAIGILGGIIVGIVGISITLSAIGDKIGDVTGFSNPMKICISPIAILSACVIALVTVMISAWIPSIRATRVTAVEAIRQSKDIKSKNKPIKTPKIVYKVFGLSGMLAQKYFKRNKKKYRSTIMSLFMSIVLFISASAFSEYIMATVATPLGVPMEYQLNYYSNGYKDIASVEEKVYADDVLDIIKSAEDVTDVAYVCQSGIMTKFNEEYFTEEYRNNLNPDSPTSFLDLMFVDDNSFRELLKENNLDENKFMNPESPLAVAIDGSMIFDYEKGKYIKNRTIIADECEFTEKIPVEIDGYFYAERINKDGESFLLYRNNNNPEMTVKVPESEAYKTGRTVKSGKTITNCPDWYDSVRGFCLVYPYSFAEKVMGDAFNTAEFYIKSDNHSNSYNSIKQLLQNNNLIYHSLVDIVAEHERDYNIITIIKVFAYGFIILISLIACANVFNTISTNIILRRREFAMLRSIGMTNKELRRMMNYECFIYGSKALIFGLPVSFGMTVLIHKAMSNGFENDFFIPWSAVAIAVLSVFIVVFATMLYSMSKIKADNLIETLKNENI